jgi:metal-dependent amidase/aminoacylase/carboxypeptidase family protein
MRNNLALARCFGQHLGALGRPARETDERVGAGSTDMGDVSHVVPSIHPYLAIVGENEALCHQHRFADAAASDRGFTTAMAAAKALARTAVELLVDDALRASVKSEWQAAQRS